MSRFNVQINDEGYVIRYNWTNDNLEGWTPTNYDGDYVADETLFFKKLINGELVLDEARYNTYLEEVANMCLEEPEPSQLDRMESTLANVEHGTSQLLADIRSEAIDGLVLELMESGVI